MEIKELKDCCRIFYNRFSALDLKPFQLRFNDSSETVSIALVAHNNRVDAEAILSISQDTVRLLKINSFDDLNSCFIFKNQLELFMNLVTLMLVCCGASNVTILPLDAFSATLGKKINNWRELVFHICSLTPKNQRKITVKQTRHGTLKFLETSFHVGDGGMLTIDGLYSKSETRYEDSIELFYALFEAMSRLLKIHDLEIDPFPMSKKRS